jgi:hypothetical protein
MAGAPSTPDASGASGVTGNGARSKLLKRMGLKAAASKRKAPPVTLKASPWDGDDV